MEQLPNPAFNDQIADTLAMQGHPYIAMALVILQIAIIPLVIFMFKFYQKRTTQIADDKKKIVDLERAVTKQERDAQIKAVDSKHEAHYVELNHRIDEFTLQINSFHKIFDRLFVKLDKIEEDVVSMKILMKHDG